MKYAVIYADPPWRFATYSHRGKGRSAEAHYNCMSLDDIKMVPVADMAMPDCALLLWTTDPLLPQALDVMASWRFVYKTIGFVWAKTTADGKRFPIGTGYYTRANPELCLLGTMGHPKRRSCAVRKLIVAPRREHSRKPDEAYARIETLFSGPYVELFQRLPRPGWDRYGNEITITQRRWRSDMQGLRAKQEESVA
jgi:N6-adenosine-specific RNA methylase IME4